MQILLIVLLTLALLLALCIIYAQRWLVRRAPRAGHASQVRADADALQAILDTLPHPVAIFSPTLVVVTANVPAVSLLSLWPGAAAETLSHRWLQPLLQQVLTRRQPVRTIEQSAAVQVFDGGREIFLLPQALPLLSGAGELTSIVLILVDATGRRQADEAKSGLLSTVSHELKTPLTSLQMAIHLLVDDASNGLAARDRDLLLTARDDADRLNRLIDDLLDVGRLRSGKAPLEIEPLCPRSIVEAAVQSLQLELAERQLTVEINLPDTLPRVRADPTRAAYMIAALLTAARRMAKAGATLSISGELQGDRLALVIQLAHEQVDPLFASPHSSAGRDGISLAVAREIAAAHQGDIDVSTAPAGPQWRLCLPQADDHG